MICLAFAGIDVGTSGCKMVAYDLEGNVLASSKREYKEMGTDGHREIDPNLVWENVQAVIRETAVNCSEKIEALAIASLGESIVCLDDKGKVLCNSMITGDKRGIEECKKLEQVISKEEVMNITGLPLSEMFSLPKFLWMHENTNIFVKAKYILFFEDFIGYKLTGNRKISYSSASRSMAFDIEKKEWSKRLLGYVGIDVEQLSEPLSPGSIVGKISEEISEMLMLSDETLVFVGGHDQNCAALGSGVVSGEQGEDGHGTCEVMLLMLPKILRTKYMIENDLSCVPYMFPDTYLTLIELTTCGILMNWCRDTLFDEIRKKCLETGEEFFTHMDSKLSMELQNLLVLPQFGSSGNPHINFDTKGLIWGLTIHTTPYEIYQAVKEGMAFQMLLAYETLLPLGIETQYICITGGGAASEYTLQMRADIFDKEIVVLENKESGTLGCAIISATAMNHFASLEDAVEHMVKIKKRFQPNKERHKKYRQQYEKYKKLYELMYDFK
ncbi:MAG: FGGY family carbohydrate kinase [Lachnospiraceae bacterium]|nr:FGGY family carbohydrate kinase [Lachnospiraceae bacterium]